MDQEGHQYDVVSNLLAYNDVDTTLTQFESVFRDQYLKNFPDVLSADVDLLVKNIRSFYLNKGTEQSYRFLFGALFDSTVNFKYPKKNILRTSDGLWFTPQYLVITDGNDNIPPELLDTTVFQVFKLIDKFITGTESGAVAFIDQTVLLSTVGLTYGGNANVESISTVESEGEFIAGEQILIGNTIVQNGSFDQDLAFWDIIPAGDRGFTTVNNQLVIEQVFGNVRTRYISQSITVDEGSQYWVRFTLSAADSPATRITVGYAPAGIELHDSANIGSNPLPFSDTVPVGPIAPGKKSLYITIWNEMGSAGNACTWDGISLVKEEFLNNVPILFIAAQAKEEFTDLQFNDANPDTISTIIGDFTTLLSAGDTFTVVGSVSNDGSYLIDSVTSVSITLDAGETLVAEGTQDVNATFFHTESGILEGVSKWKDQRGFLSEGDFVNDREIVLQDGNYYQEFSYEVKSQISIDRFESIVKDLLHPAGFKLFSAVVEPDGLVVYGLRESYYDDLVFSNDGGPGVNQAKVTRTASGAPFSSLFRKGDRVSIGEGANDATFENEGWGVVDTVDSTTLVFTLGFSLAGGNFAGTPVKLWTGIGVIPTPQSEPEWLQYAIEDPVNLNEQYYTTIEITDSTHMTRSDGRPFDEWLAVDQYFECGREFDPLHRRRFRVVAVTPTEIEIASVSNFSSKILNETVSGYSKSYAGALVRLKRGLILHTPGTYMNVEFGVDFEFAHGFGVTWSKAERLRESQDRTVEEWSGLFVADFNSKATSRFGFIDQWEIDVEGPPSSNDPNIVWDFFTPAYTEVIEEATSATNNIYFYEGFNIMDGPVFDSSCGMWLDKENIYAQKVIAAAVTPFSPGEYLCKWEKVTLFAGDWSNFTMEWISGNDGQWMDLYRRSFNAEADNSPYSGLQHMSVRIYVATDDGFGVPVPGSETYKVITFYAHGRVASRIVLDIFTGTNGTLLPAHTPNTDTVGGGWINITGGLELQSSEARGNTAGENFDILDSGQTDVEVRANINFLNTTDNASTHTRFNAAGTNGWEAEVDVQGTHPILKLWQVDASVRTLRDSLTLTDQMSNLIGPNETQLLLSTDGNLIYAEFFVGGQVSNLIRYDVEYTSGTYNTQTHIGFRLDGTTHECEDIEVVDIEAGNPRTQTIHP